MVSLGWNDRWMDVFETDLDGGQRQIHAFRATIEA
jgi:hypothetical protein